MMEEFKLNQMEILRDSYYVSSRKDFVGSPVNGYDLRYSFEFAWDMCYGDGYHRSHRSGGSVNRTQKEKFVNTIQGKLAEFCLFREFYNQGISCSVPDCTISSANVWDNGDLTITGNYTVSVKSAAHFSQLLLLEMNDYSLTGDYVPNLSIGKDATSDYYILVRISPDLKKELSYYNYEIEKQEMENILSNLYWSYDIAGYITHQDLKSIIENRQFISKGARLNGKIPMDADNYYVQCGDMRKFSNLINKIKESN